MADGRTHAKFNRKVAVTVAPPVTALTISSLPIIAIPVTILLTFFGIITITDVEGIFKTTLWTIFLGLLSFIFLIIIVIILPPTFLSWSVLLLYYLGLLFGYLITPDSDQEGVTFGEREIGNILAKPFQFLFRSTSAKRKIADMFTLAAKVFMYPYAIFIDHRSPHSHLTVWGDFWRILYVIAGIVIIISVIIMMIYGLTFTVMWTALFKVFAFIFSPVFWQEKLMFFVGSCIMSFSHLIKDGFGIRWK